MQPYHLDPSGKEPRYYQVEAINRTIEAVVNKQKRILLVMATGTGKTYLCEQFGDDHRFQRNEDHFIQLVDAWNNFDKPIDLKFFERVKLMLTHNY